MSVVLAEPSAVNPTTSEPRISETRSRRPQLYPQTDAGNADLFADLNAHVLRYDHRRKKWLHWNGHRCIVDADRYVFRRAKAAARQRLKAAASIENDGDRRKECTWAFVSEQTHAIKACLEQAMANEKLSDTGDGWDSEPYALGAKNGVVDLRTGKLRPGTPADRITMRAWQEGSNAFEAPCLKQDRLRAFKIDKKGASQKGRNSDVSASRYFQD